MWTLNEEIILKELYSSKTVNELSHFLNKKKKAIYEKANVLGLKRNLTDTNRKYSLNQKFFNIPNLNNSYWAGFILADGYINPITNLLDISLAIRDIVILETFNKTIDSNRPIYIRKKEPNDACYLRVNSKPIIQNLEQNWNIKTKKTWNFTTPNIQDKQQILAFLIGCIDGDGWIIRRKDGSFKLGLCGNLDFINWAKAILDNLIREEGNVYKNTECDIYSVDYTGQKGLKLKEKLLEVPLTFRLPRKWDIK